MKNYTYNTFTIDGQEFSMTDYKDEMKVYIKSIHPYDDADYHWALNRNGGDFYVIYIGSPGKKVDTVFGSKEKVARKLLELDKNIESRMSYESNLIRRVEKLLNESEKQIYNVEYNYGDGSQSLAIGHVKVRANSEEEALEKAEKYASNKHYRDDSYYIEDSCKIVKSGYSNDPIIESSQKNEDVLTKDILDNALYSDSFMRDRAYLTADNIDYIKIGKDEWQSSPRQSHALGAIYTTNQLWDKIKTAKELKLDGKAYRKTESLNENISDPIGTVELPIKDYFIDSVDLYPVNYTEDLIDVQFIAKDKNGTTMPIYIANGTLDKTDGEWNTYPQIKWNVSHLHDTETSYYIMDEFAKFKDERSYKLDALVKEIIKKLNLMTKNESIDQDLKSSLKTYLDQTEGKFEDIPDRNNVDWKNVSDNALNDYERLGLQLFNKKKAHDSFAYSVVKSVLDNNLDGAVIDWIKVHMEETPEITKALKEFDDALQEKDLTKSWKAYQNLWDVHRNATKRKYTKTNKTESIKESKEDTSKYRVYSYDIKDGWDILGHYDDEYSAEQVYDAWKLKLKRNNGKYGVYRDVKLLKPGQKNESEENNKLSKKDMIKALKSSFGCFKSKTEDEIDKYYSEEEIRKKFNKMYKKQFGNLFKNESVSEENLDEIYKVLDYYMTKLGFNLVEDRKPYFINKKYIKSDDTNYIHYIDFTPRMDNDQLKYEVRDEKGHQKLCNTYNILDAVDMDTSLQLIEFDMEGFE